MNYNKETVRNTNTWRLNNTFLNNQQVTEIPKGKSKNKKYIKTNDNETQ